MVGRKRESCRDSKAFERRKKIEIENVDACEHFELLKNDSDKE